MPPPPFSVRLELAGWDLCWAPLELLPGHADPSAGLAALRRGVSEQARSAYDLEKLATHPTVAAIRRLFKAAGCDPGRYRPSSEALLRRVLKGEDLPAIHPLVDLNNCLSVALAVPSCIMAEGAITPPVELRAGRTGESFDSLRGPFNLEGKPLLADAVGPFGTPITDSQRVKIEADTRRAWLVAYLPAGIVTPGAVEERLAELTGEALVVGLIRVGPV